MESNHETADAFIGDYTKDPNRPDGYKHGQKESYVYLDGMSTFWTVSRLST